MLIRLKHKNGFTDNKEKIQKLKQIPKVQKETVVKGTKKGLGNVLNRFAIMTLLILVQFGVFVVLLLELGDYTKWVSVLFTVLAVMMALFVIYRDDNPAYKIGWILLICLFPILGASMYAMVGNKRPSRRIKEKLEPVEKEHLPLLVGGHLELGNIDSRLEGTVRYIEERGPYPPWDCTKTEYYSLADDAFRELINDLRQAQSFIFLEYFIVATGSMWDEIFQILKDKAASGVDVRLIYDDVGSINKIPVTFPRKLEEAGIKVLAFNPLRPVASLVYNNRDHRKILVIDGKIAYSGGFNIADEYINREERFGHWKDTGLRLEGKAVWNYTVMFLNMWNAFMPTDKDYLQFRPYFWDESFNHLNDGIVQPYSDSPLDDERIGEDVYLEIINQAKKYVYIFTPYLILDNEMITALQLAAKRGVDVRIVTPGIPDKKLVFRLTKSYYKPLLKAGIRIYQYTPGLRGG